MIDPNELRIGNWVYYKLPNVEVKLELSDFSEMYNAQLETVIHGIPITKEWLEKFGFSKTLELHVLGHVTIESIGAAFFFEFRHKLIRRVQYVHQIQNLVFWLTGIELETKDKS